MDSFSTATAKELFSAFPQWEHLARTEKADDGTPYFVIEIPAPPEANVEHGLVIDTSNGEITVGFDVYHSHFDSLIGDGEHFGTKAALEFVKQIISERTAVVSWWADNIWRGSAPIQAGASHGVPSWSTAADTNRVRVRSWFGSCNYDGGA